MILAVVSTHSRLKAAGADMPRCYISTGSFNTQPPKGGWAVSKRRVLGWISFNTQPPKGGWAEQLVDLFDQAKFQHTAA
mgnify:FL=1